ncbi:hypothetical protein [Methylobacterium frigidaeris]|uniref:Uncharacterized protein n=2 Tax=Methylobacterium frigidaeris TaxID=2038277 RepID=A0AA37M689_9HYPH|nr:hypothetical protein [Methylobacterium frigidaeris]PIK73382.1 hypothetical protein CS379_08750 [Methylobacterium frigidaeris]GJD63744.1 hypothetical protein MPEAHAMD_3915 [Methylobacterium frigidaeris]
MRSLLLDTVAWDLALDTAGNIAVASNPYAMAQDAATAIRTYQGEVYYNTADGVPYRDQILGQQVPLSLVRAYLEAAALTVPGVVQAQAFFTRLEGRRLSGQVQITGRTGALSAASF